MFASSRLVLAAAAVLALGLVSPPQAHAASLYEELQRSVRESLDHSAPAPTLNKKQIITPRGNIAVKGQQERKMVRMAAWNLGLQGDRRQVRDTMGHPTYRMYELRSDIRTEIWTYPAANKTFVFQGNRLIEGRLD